MPDHGSLNKENIPYSLPALAPLYPPPPWEVDNVETLQIAFEIDKAHAIQWLPTTLTRPNPAYCLVRIHHYPKSPVGPFNVAHQMLMSRLRVLPRAFPIQSIVDNADALPALREVWGYPAKLGKVSLDRKGNGVTAQVERPLGKVLVRVDLRDMQPLGPGELLYDPTLGLRYTAPAQEDRGPEYTQLVQIDPGYLFKESYRGAGTISYPKQSKGDPWYLVEALDYIATTYSLCDSSLPWPRFLEDFN